MFLTPFCFGCLKAWRGNVLIYCVFVSRPVLSGNVGPYVPTTDIFMSVSPNLLASCSFGCATGMCVFFDFVFRRSRFLAL